jgi:hypothetical protein
MYKDFKELAESKSFRGILMGIGISVVLLLVFQAGMFVGFRKAAFSYKFGDNYYRAFGDRGPKPFEGKFRDGLIEGHGVVGKIVSIKLPTFVVSGPDELEKVIVINDDTRIRRFDDTLKDTDLKVDDFTVILGNPNESSQIEAKLIRVLPPPPSAGETKIK